MRVIVCGGRMYGVRYERDGSERAGWQQEHEVLWHALDNLGITELAHGNARGADALAKEWAHRVGVPEKSYPAAWVSHGKAAGPLRNQWMLEDFAPHAVVSFPGGVGTRDMCRRAKAAGVEVITP